MLVKELQQLGLSEKEAQVYLASLELGQATVQKISQKADVNRATAYFILDSLAKRGLVTSVEKEKTTLFSSEPPEQLINLIKQQEAEIKQKEKNFSDILPELKSVFNLAENKPRVRFYEGIEGIAAIQEDIIRSKPDTIKNITNIDEACKVFPPCEDDHRHKMRNKIITIKSIYISNDISRVPNSVLKLDDEYRLISYKEFPISGEISLYGKKVALLSLKEKISGVVIENKEITETISTLFDLAWQSSSNK